VIEPDALFQIVKLLQTHPDADLIYSDDDKLGEDGSRLLCLSQIGRPIFPFLQLRWPFNRGAPRYGAKGWQLPFTI